jgi:hypothetical protein
MDQLTHTRLPLSQKAKARQAAKMNNLSETAKNELRTFIGKALRTIPRSRLVASLAVRLKNHSSPLTKNNIRHSYWFISMT